jgi:hypothetical protein
MRLRRAPHPPICATCATRERKRALGNRQPVPTSPRHQHAVRYPTDVRPEHLPTTALRPSGNIPSAGALSTHDPSTSRIRHDGNMEGAVGSWWWLSLSAALRRSCGERGSRTRRAPRANQRAELARYQPHLAAPPRRVGAWVGLRRCAVCVDDHGFVGEGD